MKYTALLGASLMVASWGLAIPVWARSEDRIVAVVNEAVITYSELQDRTTLAARALDVNLTNPAAKRALERRTLTELVDETLQQQHAAALGLQLTRAELQQAKDQAVSSMGQATWAKLTKGVNAAADAKIRAEATWARLEQAVVAPRIQLGTAEIDKLIEEMSKTQDRTEKQLGMIFLPHETSQPSAPVTGTVPAEPQARLRLAREEILAANNPAEAFAAAARTMSAAPSSAQGGDLGWLTMAEVPAEIATAIAGLAVGEISNPLRTPEGWLLVRVAEIRREANNVAMQPETQYKLYLLAAARPSDTVALRGVEEALRRTARLASQEPAVAALLQDPLTTQQLPLSRSLGWVALAALRPEVARAVQQTKPGQWTALLSSAPQLSMLYVAARRQVMPPELLALRERVTQNLRANRIELESRRLMRELRQRAFVDIRL